ncbi:F0F1 ATP synthase subunit epsilon [Clostridium aestuarii]|uniref:ATP synthase epsilon chain n=1 Tax=Clostridium aestuarii TaxID=338193 RepID=A0ABT4D311_9CLOT|nr:F0F1 ATP synthase subunit epsilon [Clostridium aestuarii]MCY6485629.1 F0F1 ATP synthase subunit epsilon [Clostridium aestuarii]
MSNSINITIITPEREFYKGKIIELKTESIEGKLGILPKHLPLIVLLNPTISEFTNIDNEKKKLFSSSGVLKVINSEALMLCDACEWPENIDLRRAEESKKRAEERLKQKEGIDVHRAQLSLMRALTRIRVKNI